MDNRKALPNGTVIRMQSGMSYTAVSEAGRGASSIVYRGYYLNSSGAKRPVIIKEYYPEMKGVEREESGSLSVTDAARQRFIEQLDGFRDTFDLWNSLYDEGLAWSASYTLDLYEDVNNTSYIVTVYEHGNVLTDISGMELRRKAGIALSVAEAISRVHDAGYLYLDIKPDNIFVLNESDKVKLFDFDSLIPIEELEKLNVRQESIKATAGFSALEVREGRISDIGICSDIFSIGALLFYMIFGRAPGAADQNIYAMYDLEAGGVISGCYRPSLAGLLTDFFHLTLSGYPGDRPESMEKVIMSLTKIRNASDRSKPYLITNCIGANRRVIGRETETRAIKDAFEAGHKDLIISGMGGIGKSSLVRKFIADDPGYFDSCIICSYKGTGLMTFTDDIEVPVNNVTYEGGSYEKYFEFKLRVLREILEKESALLVIDDFSGEIDRHMLEVLRLKWNVIIITRTAGLTEDIKEINIKAPEPDAQREIFMYYLGDVPVDDDTISRITEMAGGHPLAEELIAKQIRNGRMSPGYALSILREKGFGSIGKEKIRLSKDHITASDTAKNIITGLYPMDSFSDDQRKVLRLMSLFRNEPLDPGFIKDAAELDTFDVLNELISDGWIMDEGLIRLHPVIGEIASGWQLTERAVAGAAAAIRRLKGDIMHISGRSGNAQAQIRLSEMLIKSLIDDKDGEALRSELIDLLYMVIINTPFDRDEYLTDKIGVLIGSGLMDDKQILKLYDILCEVYLERHDMRSARSVIDAAGKDILFKGDYLRACYFELRASMYDKETDLAESEQEQAALMDRILDELDNSIMYIERAEGPEADAKRFNFYLSKANILLRLNDSDQIDEVQALLEKCDMLYQKMAEEDADGLLMHERDLCIVKARLVSFKRPVDIDALDLYIKRAEAIEQDIKRSPLEMIDDFYIPAARIYYDIYEDPNAAEYIGISIDICDDEERKDSLPYIRKKLELYEIMLEIYYNADAFGSCRQLLKRIDEDNRRYEIFGISARVPDEVRKVIESGDFAG